MSSAFEQGWDLVKSIPTDIMNDPLVYISPDGRHKMVRLERDFRSWLYEMGYPTDDDFSQLDFMQQMQILFHFRVQQGASKEQSFMEDNL